MERKYAYIRVSSVDQGSHEELLAKEGQYYRLWEMQQGNFVITEEPTEAEAAQAAEADDEGVISYT